MCLILTVAKKTATTLPSVRGIIAVISNPFGGGGGGVE